MKDVREYSKQNSGSFKKRPDTFPYRNPFLLVNFFMRKNHVSQVLRIVRTTISGQFSIVPLSLLMLDINHLIFASVQLLLLVKSHPNNVHGCSLDIDIVAGPRSYQTF